MVIAEFITIQNMTALQKISAITPFSKIWMDQLKPKFKDILEFWLCLKACLTSRLTYLKQKRTRRTSSTIFGKELLFSMTQIAQSPSLMP